MLKGAGHAIDLLWHCADFRRHRPPQAGGSGDLADGRVRPIGVEAVETDVDFNVHRYSAARFDSQDDSVAYPISCQALVPPAMLRTLS